MTEIDINKKYRTRDGRDARIYALDGGGSRPVHGACKHPVTGMWVLSRWNEQGRISSSGFLGDLIEVKPRIQRTIWINIYAREDRPSTKEEADLLATSNRIACVKVEIDCEEGEGL